MSKSKQDYLQKYISGNKKEKRTKKVGKDVMKKKGGIRIIDDDYDLGKISVLYKDDEPEEFLTQEERPQIADYIDERPKEAILKENFSDRNKWKTVASSIEDITLREVNRQVRHDSESDESPVRRYSRHDTDSDVSLPHRRKGDDSDISPPRKKRQDSDLDISPARKITISSRDTKGEDIDSDQSPVRIKVEHDSDLSPKRMKDRDLSPARRMIERNLERNGQGSREISGKKVERTLEGKRSGLQSRETLRQENVEIRKKEVELFKKAPSDVTGRGAQTVARADKQRAEDEKQRKQKEKEEKIQELEKKYKAWGKG
ncbi:hypothetical protein QYM36_013385 [Artemia franciscana]|nr:hypothetical protein QYM36_013385 [Artemia franciscana]KAK2709693.1 hypothetical protein QYM36_013385 [Artemia franciscana]